MTGNAGMLDMNGTAAGAADFESDDRRKEEDEADFTFAADDLERCGCKRL
jgi:hypothetical protein